MEIYSIGLRVTKHWALRAKSKESRVKGEVAMRRYGISLFAICHFVNHDMAFRRSQNGFLSTVKWLIASREMAFYILRSLYRQPTSVFSPETVNLYQDLHHTKLVLSKYLPYPSLLDLTSTFSV
jgi:hypothetical protein